jgi:hypothetical protein
LLALHRTDEALELARSSLADPLTTQRAAIEAILDKIVSSKKATATRQGRKELEAILLERPSRDVFLALKSIFAPKDWGFHRRRLLKLLRDHQRAPDFLFELHIEEQDWKEAEEIARSQLVCAECLLRGADLVARHDANYGVDWAIMAAYRAAAQEEGTKPEVSVDAFKLARELSKTNEHRLVVDRALVDFEATHHSQAHLLSLLQKAGVHTPSATHSLTKPQS